MNSTDASSFTPLHFACLSGASPTFKRGSSIYASDKGRYGHDKVARFLVQHGADVNAVVS